MFDFKINNHLEQNENTFSNFSTNFQTQTQKFI